MVRHCIKRSLIVLIMFLAVQISLGQKSGITEEALIKKAASFFEDENWKEALPLYAQLVSVYPDNPEFNYCYGVCSLFGSRTDNKKPVRYLYNAYRTMPDNKELLNYLGMAYYQSQEFSSALHYYSLYLKTLPNGSAERKTVEGQINACLRGMDLKHINQLDEVMVKAEFQKNNFHRAYPIDEFDGSLIQKPDDFSSAKELKSDSRSFVYISEPRGVLYYSGFADEKSGHRDLFRVNLNKKGEWGDPEKLPSVINTPYDEDYPVISDNGSTLYFSSRGHNSMGGYDVFRSTYDAETGQFSKPENMGIGINSPFDDILFIPDNSGHGAYFASTRESQDNNITVYKVSLNEGLSDEERMIAQNAGSGLNLPPLEEPAYLALAAEQNKATASEGKKSGDAEKMDASTPSENTKRQASMAATSDQSNKTNTNIAGTQAQSENNSAEASNAVSRASTVAYVEKPLSVQGMITTPGQSPSGNDAGNAPVFSAEDANDTGSVENGGLAVTQSSESNASPGQRPEPGAGSINPSDPAGNAAAIRQSLAITDNSNLNAKSTETQQAMPETNPQAANPGIQKREPANDIIPGEPAFAKATDQSQQQNTAANANTRPANGLTLTWEVIYDEADDNGKEVAEAEGSRALKPAKQVNAVTLAKTGTGIQEEDEPLEIILEFDPVKQVQMVKYAAALSSNDLDETDLEIRLEQEESSQDEPTFVLTRNDPVRQVEAVEFVADGSDLYPDEESLTISLDRDPVREIQQVKYAEAQAGWRESEAQVTIIPEGSGASSRTIARSNGPEEGEPRVTGTVPANMAASAAKGSYALTSARDAGELRSLTAAESGIFSIPEPISVAMPLEAGENYSELIRTALSDPDQLTYDELLFAASMVTNNEDKLRIYYASFIRSERDWRAYYNASLAAQNTANPDQANVYMYQASLIYTEELVGQISPGLFMKLR